MSIRPSRASSLRQTLTSLALHGRLCSALALSALACAEGSKPAVSQKPVSDAGDTGGHDGDASNTCSAPIAVTPSPNLSGRWALKTVASRYVPKTGLTAAFYTTTTSLLLSDITQTDTRVSLSAQYCDQYAEDPNALAHVVIPDAYKQSLAPFVRVGTYADDGTGTDVSNLPSFIEVEGATLADPAETLPTAPDDPRVNDQDGDGNPGVTIKLSGLVSGDMYVVQRQSSVLTGVATAQDRISGRYEFTTEQNILASNPAEIKALAAQTAIVDPNACASTFVFVRLADTATCADVLANATLFE